MQDKRLPHSYHNNLLIKAQKPEVCDATMLNSSTVVGIIILTNKAKALLHLLTKKITWNIIRRETI
jgi:hypothetical protein